MKNKPVFYKVQNPACASTEEVELMCVEEFADFLEPTACITSKCEALSSSRVLGRFNGSFYSERAAPTFVPTSGCA